MVPYNYAHMAMALQKLYVIFQYTIPLGTCTCKFLYIKAYRSSCSHDFALIVLTAHI